MVLSASFRRATIAALLTVASATAASATTAVDYTVVTKNSFTGANSDVEGALAAGGAISLSNYAIGTALPSSADNSYTLISGGAATLNSGQLYHGKVMATSVNASNFTYSGSAPYSAAASPINISSEFNRLGALSADMANNSATYGATGSVTYQYNQIYAIGSNSDVNVFNISASMLSSLSGLHLFMPTGATALFNVNGSSVTIGSFGWDTQTGGVVNPGFNYNTNYDASHVLFNFYNATSIQSNGSIEASVLATGASYNGGYLHVNGQTIADTITGNTQFNAIKLANTTSGKNLLALSAASPAPETSTWAMMMVGFGVVGASIRRQRRRGAGLLAA